MACNPDPVMTEERTVTAEGEMAPGVLLDDFAPYLLNRIVNRINANLSEALKETGITVPIYRVLAVLIAGNGRTVNELAVYTVIEQSTLSKILARMESQGLVSREPNKQDGRVVEIHITDAGRNAYERVLPIALSHHEQAMAGLGPRERRDMIATLHRVLDNVRHSPFP